MEAARQRAQYGQAIDGIEQWFRLRKDALESFMAMIKACHHLRPGASPADAVSINRYLDDVQDFGNRLATAQGEEDLKHAKSLSVDIQGHLRTCQEALRRVARELVQRDFLPFKATGELISEIDPTSTLGKRLVDFVARVERLDSQPPAEFAEKIRVALAEAKGYRVEIDALADRPERKAFMNALVTGKATLAEVTPAILDWLTAAGAIHRFAVKPLSQVR